MCVVSSVTDSSDTSQDEPKMRPLSKARSTTSVVSTLSLISNSLSELDLRSHAPSDYQCDDLESISDTASVVTVRSMKSAPGDINMIHARDRENGRVTRDLPAGRSVAVMGLGNRLGHNTSSLRYTSFSRDMRSGDRASRRSILSLSALDNLKVSSVDEPLRLRVSSVDDIPLMASSVDPPVTAKADQNAESDVDSYSDITGSVSNSEPKANGILKSASTSSLRSHGSISSLRSQKSEKSAPKQTTNSRSTILSSTPNGTRNVGVLDETVKSVPVVQVASSRSSSRSRVRSGDRTRDRSLSNHRSRPATNHRASLSSDGENLSSDEDYQMIKPQTNHVKTVAGNTLLNSERNSRRTTSSVVSNHVEQLAEQMDRARKSSVGNRQRKLSALRVRADSVSSQESSESLTNTATRQHVAEQAAAILMNNHVEGNHGNPGHGKHSQSLEMKEISADRRKQRREQLAKMASLQSSSC